MIWHEQCNGYIEVRIQVIRSARWPGLHYKGMQHIPGRFKVKKNSVNGTRRYGTPTMVLKTIMVYKMRLLLMMLA